MQKTASAAGCGLSGRFKSSQNAADLPRQAQKPLPNVKNLQENELLN
jgi:hypothetical protein